MAQVFRKCQYQLVSHNSRIEFSLVGTSTEKIAASVEKALLEMVSNNAKLYTHTIGPENYGNCRNSYFK